MAQRALEPIQLITKYNIELPAFRGEHEAIEFGSESFAPETPVPV
jgi:hypothetical protein